MEGHGHGRLPGEDEAVGRGACTAEEAYAQRLPRSGWSIVDRREGDLHCGIPDLLVLIDVSGDLVAGVPLDGVAIAHLVAVDIEVHPLGLRRDFKLLVLTDVLIVGADEGLSDVPVPEAIGFFRGVGLWLEIQIVVGSDVEQVEIVFWSSERGPLYGTAPACPWYRR